MCAPSQRAATELLTAEGTGVFHCHPFQEWILADLDDLSPDGDVLQGLKMHRLSGAEGNSTWTCSPLIWAAVRDVIIAAVLCHVPS